jgi:hypothetical protein
MEAGTRQKAIIVHEKAARYISDAWKTLLESGPKLALAHQIKPQDIMLGQWMLLLVLRCAHSCMTRMGSCSRWH